MKNENLRKGRKDWGKGKDRKGTKMRKGREDLEKEGETEKSK